jgi:hypothetical protein
MWPLGWLVFSELVKSPIISLPSSTVSSEKPKATGGEPWQKTDPRVRSLIWGSRALGAMRYVPTGILIWHCCLKIFSRNVLSVFGLWPQLLARWNRDQLLALVPWHPDSLGHWALWFVGETHFLSPPRASAGAAWEHSSSQRPLLSLGVVQPSHFPSKRKLPFSFFFF